MKKSGSKSGATRTMPMAGTMSGHASKGHGDGHHAKPAQNKLMAANKMHKGKATRG